MDLGAFLDTRTACTKVKKETLEAILSEPESRRGEKIRGLCLEQGWTEELIKRLGIENTGIVKRACETEKENEVLIEDIDVY